MLMPWPPPMKADSFDSTVRAGPQPALMSPMTLATGMRTSVRKTSLKCEAPRGLHERPDLDARAVHVDEDERDALVLGHVGVGAHEEHAPVAELRGRVPDLLAGDDELVAVADGLAGEAGEVGAGAGLAEELADR